MGEVNRRVHVNGGFLETRRAFFRLDVVRKMFSNLVQSNSSPVFTMMLARRHCCRQQISVVSQVCYAQIRCLSDEGPKSKSLKVKKKAKKAKQDDPGGKSRDLDLMLASLDAPSKLEPQISQEEKDYRHQVGRDYGIGKFRQHNEIDHDLSCKIRMKQHAMNMLPKDTKLREQAMKIDFEGPPRWKLIPVWTPPLPDFDPTEFREQDD
jgi:hypothetical protein